MTSYVLDNKLYDEDYMRNHTAFPFLVDEATGKLLRSNEADEASCLVWDTARQEAVPHVEAGDSTALEGEFVVEGKPCTTTFELLKKAQKDHTTSWASDKTGIPKEEIEEIARKYACNGPAAIAYGMGGCDKFSNPDIAGHAMVALLQA